jgi:hypothetical protein
MTDIQDEADRRVQSQYPLVSPLFTCHADACISALGAGRPGVVDNQCIRGP